MVLIRRKQVELVKPPAQVEGQDPDVFYLAATGEIFLDYESYTSRLSFYNQNLFQCELTGRVGLTFFQALLSENDELARLIRNFPDILKGPVLKSANFAIVGRLDQLVDNIFERFHNRFFPGDEVTLEIDGEKYQAEVRDVYPPRSVWRIHQEAIVESKLREYEARRSASNSPVKPKRSPTKATASSSKASTSAQGAASEAAAAAAAAAAAEDSDSDLSELTELPPASQEFLASIAEAAALSLTAADVAHKIGCDLEVAADKALKLDPPEDYLYRLRLRPGATPGGKSGNAEGAEGSSVPVGAGAADDNAGGEAPSKGRSSGSEPNGSNDAAAASSSTSVAGPKTGYAASTYEARASSLSRDRLKFSKTILKKLLREAMRREPHVGAPWKVRSNWAQVYGINTVPSEAIAKKNESIREAKLQKRKKIVEEPAAEPPTKKSKKATQAELKRQAAEEARLAKEKEEEEKRLKAEKKKNLKYPCEDFELDPINARELSAHVPGEVPRQKKRPACKRELPGGVSGRLWEDLLAVYGYLQAVGKPLQLSPFTLDDFEAALRHNTHEPQCTLIVEIHAAVLNTIIRDGNFSKELAPAALSSLVPIATAAAAADSGSAAASPTIVQGSAVGRLASLKREEDSATPGPSDLVDSKPAHVPTGRSVSASIKAEGGATAPSERISTRGGGGAANARSVSGGTARQIAAAEQKRASNGTFARAANGTFAKASSNAVVTPPVAPAAVMDRGEGSSSGGLAPVGGGALGRRESGGASNGHSAGAAVGAAAIKEEEEVAAPLPAAVVPGSGSGDYGLMAPDASFANSARGGGGGGSGFGDILDITPEELVLSNALHAGRGWEKRILKYDDGRQGWEVALVGCLAKRATAASVPRLWGILSQLTGTDHPEGRMGPHGTFVAETFPDEATRYPILPLKDKVAALQFVCELSMMTKYVRGYFEECENALTELRKERAEISRARKQVDEERRDLAVKELLRLEAEGIAEAEAAKAVAVAEAGTGTGAVEGLPILTEDTNSVTNGKRARAKSGTPASEDERDQLEDGGLSDDDSGGEWVPDDDAASSTAASDSGPSSSAASSANKRPRLASRQETLRKQAIEREAAEAAREAERVKAAQAKKDKNAEARQLANERKRLEEENAKVTKREEAWEREFRRFQFGPRLRPLGYDRFYQRYWWFDGLGTAPLVNQAGNMVYSTGRIFIQGPSEDEWDFLLSEYPEAEVRARAAEELGENELLEGGEWGFYDEPETVEELFAWLRVRGVREDKFKKEFVKWRHYILAGMTRRNESLTSTTKTEPLEGRRSVRSKTEASRQSHMVWTNKAALK
ncbi:hypothetical protein V8E36_000871 [Tilletia maclaganii]